MNIVWIPHSQNPVYAGVRLRCLIPAAALRSLGHRVTVQSAPDFVAKQARVIVQAKWLVDVESVNVLRERIELLASCKQDSCLLVLDSFDNYFSKGDQGPERAAILAAYRAALPLFDRFVVASVALEQSVLEASGAVPQAVHLVGDPIETANSHKAYESWTHRFNPKRWPAHMAASKRILAIRRARRQTRQLIWFGNHGSPGVEGGMSELAALLPLLKEINQRIPLQLNVVSNSREKFSQVTGGSGVSCQYFDWDRLHFIGLLQEHDLVVLPSRITNWTASKSNNRLLLPLTAGVPVMADALPDYLPWRDYCAIDEWDKMEQHLAAPSELARRAQAFKADHSEAFSEKRIALSWEAALK